MVRLGAAHEGQIWKECLVRRDMTISITWRRRWRNNPTRTPRWVDSCPHFQEDCRHLHTLYSTWALTTSRARTCSLWHSCRWEGALSCTARTWPHRRYAKPTTYMRWKTDSRNVEVSPMCMQSMVIDRRQLCIETVRSEVKCKRWLARDRNPYNYSTKFSPNLIATTPTTTASNRRVRHCTATICRKASTETLQTSCSEVRDV
jgi:hypothetical protein